MEISNVGYAYCSCHNAYYLELKKQPNVGFLRGLIGSKYEGIKGITTKLSPLHNFLKLAGVRVVTSILP